MPMMRGSSFAQGLSVSIVLNVVQKVITFSLNNLLIRRTNPNIFGIAAVQLELFLSTLLFFSREGIRLALVRERIETPLALQKFINLSWLPSFILALLLITYVFRCVYIDHTLQFGEVGIGDNKSSFGVGKIDTEDATSLVISLYMLGALFEAWGEPWVNVYHSKMILTQKSLAETSAVFARSVCAFLMVAEYKLGVLGFGIAQAVYGLTYLLVMTSPSLASSALQYFDRPLTMGHFFFRRCADNETTKSTSSTITGYLESYFSLSTMYMAMTTTASSILKHFLTEADKIVLTLTRSSEEQGVFAVASNYGSLAARLLLAPIEESARVAFSKYHIVEMKEKSGVGSKEKKKKKKKTDQNTNSTLQPMMSFFVQLVHIVLLIGSVMVIFGSNYVQVAVDIMFPAHKSPWNSAEVVNALVAYCFYIFILSLNGISEAFVYAVAPPSDFTGINITLIAGLIACILGNMAMGSMGAAGIVLCGCLSYLVRIVFSFRYIYKYFDARCQGQEFVQSMTPKMDILTIGILIGTYSVCYTSARCYNTGEKSLKDMAYHVGCGGMCFLVCVAYMRKDLTALISVLRKKNV